MGEYNYIGTAVHGYRRVGRHNEEIVVRVTATGNHCYDGRQHEAAIRASTRQHPRLRWYVGYGGDYVPASRSDIANIVVISRQTHR